MTENDKEIEALIPTSFKVDLFEWTNDFWNGKNFIRIRLTLLDGQKDIVLMPSEANCLADLLKETLNGVDISYDMKKAYEEAEMKGYCKKSD